MRINFTSTDKSKISKFYMVATKLKVVNAQLHTESCNYHFSGCCLIKLLIEKISVFFTECNICSNANSDGSFSSREKSASFCRVMKVQ